MGSFAVERALSRLVGELDVLAGLGHLVEVAVVDDDRGVVGVGVERDLEAGRLGAERGLARLDDGDDAGRALSDVVGDRGVRVERGVDGDGRDGAMTVATKQPFTSVVTPYFTNMTMATIPARTATVVNARKAPTAIWLVAAETSWM